MQQSGDEPTKATTNGADPAQGRKPYRPPTVHAYGSVRDLTLTAAAGPNFDGGAEGNIYAS